MDLISRGANELSSDFTHVLYLPYEDIVCKDFESTLSTENILQRRTILDDQHKIDKFIIGSCMTKLDFSSPLVYQEKQRVGIRSIYDFDTTSLETDGFYCREETKELEIIQCDDTFNEMREELVCWIEDTTESIKCLRELADEIEAIFNKTSKAKIGGSAASIAGGIVSAVGFGLSFATFGSSLILAIVGGVVAGAGGVTTGTASIVNMVKSSSKTKAAEEAIKKYKQQSDKIKRKCIEISKTIKDIDSTIPEWVNFWGKLTKHCVSTAANAGWSVVGKTIVTSLKLSSDLAGDASSASKTVFNVAGTTARGFHIAGGVVGILLLPVDVHTLVSSARDVGKGKAPDSTIAIREVADKMAKECPNKDEVDKMIECTIDRLNSYYKENFHKHSRKKNLSNIFTDVTNTGLDVLTDIRIPQESFSVQNSFPFTGNDDKNMPKLKLREALNILGPDQIFQPQPFPQQCSQTWSDLQSPNILEPDEIRPLDLFPLLYNKTLSDLGPLDIL